jgi:hypothetical protein
MKWKLVLIITHFFCFLSFSQETNELLIHVNIGNEIVVLNEHIQVGDSIITITSLKFYLTVVDEHDRSIVQLIDWSEAKTNRILCTASSRLFLGTDSLTNVSGNLESDLDPIHGMYWSWNSGYINFKLEGYWNNQEQQKFEYHIGGYRAPFETFRKIGSIDLATNELLIDLGPLFKSSSEKMMPSIMTPGKNAFLFSEKLINSFQLK